MNNTITFSYTREQLENLWNIKITDKMWVDLQTKDSGFQHAVHQEVIGLVEYISDYCDYCSDPETDDETDCDDDVCCVGCQERVCGFNEEPPHKDERGEAVCDECWTAYSDDETDWDERDIKILGFNTKDRLDGDYQSLLFEIRNHEFKPKKKKKKIIKRPKPETEDEREMRQYLERIAGYK